MKRRPEQGGEPSPIIVWRGAEDHLELSRGSTISIKKKNFIPTEEDLDGDWWGNPSPFKAGEKGFIVLVEIRKAEDGISPRCHLREGLEKKKFTWLSSMDENRKRGCEEVSNQETLTLSRWCRILSQTSTEKSSGKDGLV